MLSVHFLFVLIPKIDDVSGLQKFIQFVHYFNFRIVLEYDMS